MPLKISEIIKLMNMRVGACTRHVVVTVSSSTPTVAVGSRLPASPVTHRTRVLSGAS
jgi:hypothetical protein